MGSRFDFDITLYRGAGAYICGEETALLESLEGKRGQPRLKPPFPAVAGLYASPTLINNVETLAALPPIIEQGAGLVRGHGHREEHRHQGVLDLGPRRAAGELRDRHGRHHAARAGLRHGRRVPPGPRLRRRLGRRVERERGGPRGPRHARSTTSRWPPPAPRSARPDAS